MTRALSIAAAVAVLALAVAGCGGGGSKRPEQGESEGTKTTIAGLSANDHGSKQVSGKTEVELDDYYFEPTVLKGKPGSKVTLELKNEGKVEHNFSIDAQHIDKDIDAGEGATVAVTIPQSGELSFYCKYHKNMGMAGALAASS
jgi:plastocyanin